MAIKTLCLVALIALFSTPLCAQDISGTWQGSIGNRSSQRFIIRIEKAADDWKALLFSLDFDFGSSIPANSVKLEESHIRVVVDNMGSTYDGTLSPDTNTIDGTWTWPTGSQQPFTIQRTKKENEWQDSATHAVQFIEVAGNVKLEVLDWGGTGRPLIFLSGLGSTAHVFDRLVTMLNGPYHIYGITRRGFGASSKPKDGYSADRLGDDVLAVMEALKIEQPVLIGHSIGGEELSSIGSRYPRKVAGLIYLDAAYAYAFYDGSVGEFPKTDLTQPPRSASEAIMAGLQKYTDIRVPALAIFAVPPAELQATAVEKGIPSARVVRLSGASHWIFLSNQADVLREMKVLLGNLPKPQ
jgi:pimeloyl-ACP methyl ester carboxylesterase